MLEAMYLHADCYGHARIVMQLTIPEPPVVSLRCPVAVRPHSSTPVTMQLTGALSCDQLHVQVCLCCAWSTTVDYLPCEEMKHLSHCVNPDGQVKLSRDTKRIQHHKQREDPLLSPVPSSISW